MENLNKEFYSDSWARSWSDMKKYSPVGRHTRRIISRLILRLESKNKIADFGCGDGSLISCLASRHPKSKFYGCDFSDESIKQCKERFTEGKFVVHDVLNNTAPFKEKINIGITSEVLEHIEDDKSALSNMAQWCEYLIVTVPGGKLDSSSVQMGHLRHYTKKSLISLAQASGLNVIFMREWGFPFAYPWYAKFRNKAGYDAVTGRYGFMKKMLCHFLYALFVLNDAFDCGNKIFMICQKSNSNA